MTCRDCGGSGILTVEFSYTLGDDGRLAEDGKAPYQSWCHSCPAGAAWREAGVE